MNQLPNEFVSYKFWDLTPPNIPIRSRLYHVEPCGLGTPFVESLTSYVLRLAEAYNVSVLTFIKRELAPHLARSYLATSNKAETHYSAFWLTYVQSMNGMGILSRDIAQVLEALTLRTKLNSLSTLPWANIFSGIGLLKSQHSWCPDCFREWQSAKKPIYEPLLWYIQPVTLCPCHQRPLVNKCPYEDCRAGTPVLTGKMTRVGYCPRCSRWLGTLQESEDISVPDEESSWQNWVSNEIGQLLVHNLDVRKTLKLSNLPLLIAMCYEQTSLNSLTKFERRLGIAAQTILKWRDGERIPQIGSLLRLCYCCGVSLSDLLTFSKKRFKILKLRECLLPATVGKYQTHRTAITFDISSVQLQLEEILKATTVSPPSMDAVARRLGHTSGEFRKYFPDLCKAISAKYMLFRETRSKRDKEKKKRIVYRAILKLTSQGIYPGLRKVAALVGKKRGIHFLQLERYWKEGLKNLEKA